MEAWGTYSRCSARALLLVELRGHLPLLKCRGTYPYAVGGHLLLLKCLGTFLWALIPAVVQRSVLALIPSLENGQLFPRNAQKHIPIKVHGHLFVL
jgi:hypothetical protein